MADAQQAQDEAAAGAEETVKIICLGDSAVGKSKLLERFLLDGFRPQQLSTFALTLYKHRAQVDGQTVLVGLSTPVLVKGAGGNILAKEGRVERGLALCCEGELETILGGKKDDEQLILSFKRGLYSKQLRTAGENMMKKLVGRDFWDTAGQERFQSMHASYYHKAHACIMVFDVQRKVTYKNLNSWYKELREFRPEIPCVVVANKIDADTKVTQKSFNFARKFSLPFYFVSAADGTNVVKLFNDAIKLAVAYKQNSGDFMDEVMRELENFDLQKKSENLSDQEESCPEETPPSA